MFGLLISKEKSWDIREAVKGKEIWFEKIGEFNSETFLQHCQAAASISLQYFIVDADCTDAQSLVKGLRIFRSSRQTRIILIATGRKPGDVVINKLLPLQIWDIIAPEDVEDEDDDDDDTSNQPSYLTILIQQQLATEFSYGNVARWDVANEEFFSGKPEQPVQIKEKKEKEEKERKPEQPLLDPTLVEFIESIEPPVPQAPKPPKEVIIYKDRFVGTIFVSVTGTSRNTGTTFAAIQIATYLSIEKKVALIQLSKSKRSLLDLYRTNENVRDDSIMIDRVCCYPNGNSETITSALMQDYDYIVLDIGPLIDDSQESEIRPSEYMKEFARSDVHIITMGSSLIDEENALLLLDYLFKREWEKKLQFLVNFTTNNSFKRINQFFGKKQKNELNIAFHQNPLFDDPESYEEGILETLLDSVIAKKKKKFKLFKRG